MPRPALYEKAFLPMAGIVCKPPQARHQDRGPVLQPPAILEYGPVVRPLCSVERRERPPIRIGRFGRAALGALGEVVGPDAVPLSNLDRWLTAHIAGLGAYLPAPLPRLLPWALASLEFLPMVVGPRRGRLSRLSHEGRDRFLARLHGVRGLVREGIHALCSLVAYALYEHPDMAAGLQYDPQPFVDEKVAERANRFGVTEPW